MAQLDQSLTGLSGRIVQIDLPDFKEGVHVHQRDGWFYLSYGYQYPQRVADLLVVAVGRVCHHGNVMRSVVGKGLSP